MDADQQLIKPAQPASPTELLAAQTRSLAELVEIQRTQKGQIEELQRQNERLIGALAPAERDRPARGVAHVKVDNINMPFWALVGFLIKVSLASIPAFIILAILYTIIVFLLGLAGVAIGGVLGGFQ
jgi:hypothetical protein